MTTSTLAAAKYLGKLSGYSLSNLQLQKILYIADMVHTGAYKKRLIDEDFEAWDYGPVLPNLYHACKYAGSSPVPEGAFFWADDLPDDSPEAQVLQKAWQALKDEKPADLIKNTHWSGGAWYKRYSPDRSGDCRITEQDMIEEYEARIRAKEEKKASDGGREQAA